MGGRVAAGCVSAGFLAAASVLALEAADPAAEALAGAAKAVGAATLAGALVAVNIAGF